MSGHLSHPSSDVRRYAARTTLAGVAPPTRNFPRDIPCSCCEEQGNNVLYVAFGSELIIDKHRLELLISAFSTLKLNVLWAMKHPPKDRVVEQPVGLTSGVSAGAAGWKGWGPARAVDSGRRWDRRLAATVVLARRIISAGSRSPSSALPQPGRGQSGNADALIVAATSHSTYLLDLSVLSLVSAPVHSLDFALGAAAR